MTDTNPGNPPKHPNPTTTTTTTRRRRRPPISCTECRRRKLGCNRLSPCSQCVRSKKGHCCRYVYVNGSSQQQHQQQSYPDSASKGRGGRDCARNGVGVDVSIPTPVSSGAGTAATGTGDYGMPAPAPTLGTGGGGEGFNGFHVFKSKPAVGGFADVSLRGDAGAELRALWGRVRALEGALATSGTGTGASTGSATTAPETVSTKPAVPTSDLPSICFRKKNGKTQFSGRSHWMTTLSCFDDIGKYMEHIHQTRPEHCNKELKRMKRLKNEVTSTEKAEYLTPSNMRAFRLHDLLPDKELADQLVDLYLSTFENTFRVLHVPRFIEEYNALWVGEEPKTVFIAKLLAMMASASCFYGVNDHATPGSDFSLSQSARGWALAVQSWVSSTIGRRERVNVDVVQVQCLLLIAGNATAFEGELGWVSSGSLLRNAMMLGLHRDPCHFPNVSKYYAEVRRRLWLTIVELDLQAALENGMAPSISLDEYDTTLPANVEDERLFENLVDDPVPTDLAGSFTRTSFQLVLARSFPTRMRIAKLVNSLHFDLSYDEVLRLTQELIQYLHDVPFYFSDCGQTNMFFPGMSKSITFALSSFRFLIYRSLLVLHRPFALKAYTDRASQERFLYSRRICTESCLALLAPLTPTSPEQTEASTSPRILHLKGMTLCDEIFHAAITICLELRSSANEVALPILPVATWGRRNQNQIQNPKTPFGNITNFQRDTMLHAVESTINNFAARVQKDRQCCKVFLFLVMAFMSARRLLFEPERDVISFFQEKCTDAVMHGKVLLGLASRGGGTGRDKPGLYAHQPPTPATDTYQGIEGDSMFSQLPTLSLDGSLSDFDISALLDIPDLGLFDFPDLGAA